MAALASIADYEALTGSTVSDDDIERVERLLEMASAAIERWCNRTFAKVEDDEITVRVDDGVLYLPNGPIASVTSITGPSSPWLPAASEVDPAGWQEIHGHVIRRYGWWGCGSYEIVYTHGYDPIPDDIVMAVCQMVSDIVGGPGAPVGSEKIGEAAITYLAGAGRVVVPADVKDALRPYRVVPSSVRLVR